MRFKTAVLWWLLNDEPHPELTDQDKTIGALIPLVEALFPGINFFSTTGYISVMHQCVLPALKKQFPEFIGCSADSVAGTMTEIKEVMPSEGYQWQDDPKWRQRFEKFLKKAA